MKLNEIKNKGNWSDIAGQLNTNFGKISTEVDALNNATKKNKGFYSSLQALKSAHPTSSNGSIAYVREGDKFKLYAWDAAWVDTGMTYTENIELGDYYTKAEIDDVIGEWNDEPIANVIGDRYGEDQDFNLWGKIRETKGRVSDAEENINRLGNQLIDFRDFASAGIDNNSKIITAVGHSLLEETERAKDAEEALRNSVSSVAEEAQVGVDYGLGALTNIGLASYPEFVETNRYIRGDIVRIGFTLYKFRMDYNGDYHTLDDVASIVNITQRLESVAEDVFVNSGDISRLENELEVIKNKDVELTQSQYDEQKAQGLIDESKTYYIIEG